MKTLPWRQRGSRSRRLFLGFSHDDFIYVDLWILERWGSGRGNGGKNKKVKRGRSPNYFVDDCFGRRGGGTGGEGFFSIEGAAIQFDVNNKHDEE